MARARNIKPGFYKNEQLAECSIWARYIFPGLWQMADREGRLEDRPKRIKGELLPYDTQNVEPLLQELHERDFILRYSVGEVRYIQILNFTKHQHPHQKEPVSSIPPPTARTGQSPGGTHTKSRTEAELHEEEVPGKSGAGTSRARLNPESPLPLTHSLNPESPSPESRGKNIAAAARRPAKEEGRTNPVWAAYADAYQRRYSAQPTRNGRVNKHLATFLTLVPTEEAPDIAAFFVRSNRGLYVSAKHPVNLLQRDAEALRTEWLTGRQGTDSEARQADRTAATGNAFGELIDESRRAA